MFEMLTQDASVQRQPGSDAARTRARPPRPRFASATHRCPSSSRRWSILCCRRIPTTDPRARRASPTNSTPCLAATAPVRGASSALPASDWTAVDLPESGYVPLTRSTTDTTATKGHPDEGRCFADVATAAAPSRPRGPFAPDRRRRHSDADIAVVHANLSCRRRLPTTRRGRAAPRKAKSSQTTRRCVSTCLSTRSRFRKTATRSESACRSSSRLATTTN